MLVSIIMTTLNNELIRTLELAGFDKNQAKVYLSCLEIGPSSIWDIAQKSGIKRPTCYVILDELAARGFASKTNDGRRTIYTVSSPKELIRSFERRQEQFSRSIGQLEALSSKSGQKPVIRFYQGQEGIQEVYNLSLDMPKGSEHLLVGINMRMPDEYANFIEEFIFERRKRGIRTRAIYPDTEENKAHALKDEIESRETRFVPASEFDPRTQMYMFGDRIAYIAYAENEPFATLVESSAIAYDELQRFNLLWKTAEKQEEIV